MSGALATIGAPPAPGTTPVLAWDGRSFSPTTALSVASLTLSDSLAAASLTLSGALTAGSITNSGLTSGRVVTASTGGLLTSPSALLWTSPALTIGDGTVGPSLTIDGAAGANRQFLLKTAGLTRWNFRANSTAESGADAGSVLQIQAFDDAGTLIDTPIAVTRAAAGTIAFARAVAGTSTVWTSTSTAAGFRGTAASTFGTAAQAPITTFSGGVVTPLVQALSVNSNGSIAAVRYDSGTATSGAVIIGKSKSTTVGTPGVITTGDTLGNLFFQGDDGTNFVNTAAVVGLATGTIATGQVPGLLRFQTATSAGTLTTCGQIDSTQCLVIGGNFTSSLFTGGTARPHVQTAATSANNANMAQSIWINSTAGSTQILAKSRSTTVNTAGVVTTGDTLGTLSFQGDDGTQFVASSAIIGSCEGTIATGIVSGRFRFQTADSAGALQNAMAIDSNQVTLIGYGAGIGTNGSYGTFTAGAIRPTLQVMGAQSTDGASSVSITCFRATAGRQPQLIFAKAASNTTGTMTAVTTGYVLGALSFQGADGTNFIEAAKINVTTVGSTSTGICPGNVTIQTATTAGTLTTAITVTNAQAVTIDTGIFTTSNTTDASAVGTASVVMVGGLSVAKKFYLGSDFNITDAKNIVLGSSTGNQLGTANTQKLGLWGATPIAQKTGYGTPTGNVQTTNFPGATATLLQTAQELAQLLLDLKAAGIIGA